MLFGWVWDGGRSLPVVGSCTHAWNLSTQEDEAGGLSLVGSQYREFQASQG